MKNDKTVKIREMAKQKASSRQEEVLAAIKRMKKEGIKVTFYSVAKETGASKSYLYGNEAISAAISEARQQTVAPRSKAGDKAVIAAQQAEIKKLKKALTEAQSQNDDSYKIRCERLQAENTELKKQLESAYTVW